MNVAGDLLATAGRLPGKAAVRGEGTELTFGVLDALSARVAGLLGEHGLEPGDGVALLLPVVPELAAVFYGVLRAGAAAVLLAPRLGPRAIAARLLAERPRLLVAWHARAEAAEAAATEARTPCLFVTPGEFARLVAGRPPEPVPVPRPPEATAVVVGGGRGRRALTHAAVRRHAADAGRRLRLAGGDVALGAADPSEAPELACVLHATLVAGGAVSLPARAEPGRALAALGRDGVTVLPAPAETLAALARAAAGRAPGPALRICVAPAAPLDPSLAALVRAHLGAPVVRLGTAPAGWEGARQVERPGAGRRR